MQALTYAVYVRGRVHEVCRDFQFNSERRNNEETVSDDLCPPLLSICIKEHFSSSSVSVKNSVSMTLRRCRLSISLLGLNDDIEQAA